MPQLSTTCIVQRCRADSPGAGKQRPPRYILGGVIEHGHEHLFVPYSKYDTPDGGILVKGRCKALPSTYANPMPLCNLEIEWAFYGDVCAGIQFRFNGIRIDALDLIRLHPLPIRECSVCDGEPMVEPCAACGGIGIEAADGGKIAKPNLQVRA